MDSSKATSEERLRRALSSANLGVWEWDIAHDEVTWSPEVYALFGVEQGKFEGTAAAFLSCVHPDDRAGLSSIIEEAVRSGAGYQVEHRVASAAQGERWVECKGSVFRDASGTAQRIAGVVWDITDRKRMHQQLRLADRMATVGTLTASVAHEINNPLSYWIVSLANVDRELEAMERGLPAMSMRELRSTVAEMKTSAERVRQIVRDLRIFSRPDEDTRRSLDVRAVLESAIHLVENELRARARLSTSFGEVPLVDGNDARLGQVFLNLLVNAMQAIAPGSPEQNVVAVRTYLTDEGDVAVEVKDTGAGIPASQLASIFDPFFTTKPVGFGTGLGLSICHNIVSAHGGRITVTSAPGVGSTFTVVFPPAVRAAPRAVDATAPTETHHSFRLLIIDDQPNVATSLQLALRHHKVDAVSTAREGLLRTVTGDYDCILCDLMMPEMGGPEFYEAVREARPGAEKRIIFFTGGAYTARAREFVASMKNPLVEKPVILDRLEALIASHVAQLATQRPSDERRAEQLRA